MMRIEHLAIWANDIELLRQFYTKYFDFSSGGLYRNAAKQFSSYFLTPPDGGVRLEIMNVPQVSGESRANRPLTGYAHMAIHVGGKERVDALTERLRGDGYAILSEPRTTGDGYYESTVADPEGNYVEITT